MFYHAENLCSFKCDGLNSIAKKSENADDATRLPCEYLNMTNFGKRENRVEILQLSVVMFKFVVV